MDSNICPVKPTQGCKSVSKDAASGSLTDEQLEAECIENGNSSQLVVHFHIHEPCQGHPMRDRGLIETRVAPVTM